MVVKLAEATWGPQFIVPTVSMKTYCGCVLLRENFDNDLLNKELQASRIPGHPVGYNNCWYIRKKGTRGWIKVGESSDRLRDFGIRLDTTEFPNGPYQVMGFMNVRVKTERDELIYSAQNIADFEIKN